VGEVLGGRVGVEVVEVRNDLAVKRLMLVREL